MSDFLERERQEQRERTPKQAEVSWPDPVEVLARDPARGQMAEGSMLPPGGLNMDVAVRELARAVILLRAEVHMLRNGDAPDA